MLTVTTVGTLPTSSLYASQGAHALIETQQVGVTEYRPTLETSLGTPPSEHPAGKAQGTQGPGPSCGLSHRGRYLANVGLCRLASDNGVGS